MPDVMACLVVDEHLSNSKQTAFRDVNYFSIAYMVSAYSLRQMQLRLVADSSTRLRHNALYYCRSLRFDIAFHGICVRTNPIMRS